MDSQAIQLMIATAAVIGTVISCFKMLTRRFEKIDNEFKEVRKEISINKEELKKEISINKEELKKEISINKEELKKEMSNNKEEIKNELSRLTTRVAIIETKIEMNGRIVYIKAEKHEELKEH